MIYHDLGRSGLKASCVGLGCEHLVDKNFSEVDRVIGAAVDGGINILDVFMPQPEVRDNIGRALQGRREKVLLQGHICTVCEDGQYARTRDLKRTKSYFEDFYTRYRTDYVDIGMIHFVDTPEEVRIVLEEGVMDYARSLKKAGRVRTLGVSSHNPVAARMMVETGLVDVLMFSINPAYDMLPKEVDIEGMFKEESYQNGDFCGLDPERAKLYATCEALGVGITVMKPLAGGAMISPARTPFGRVMTVPQLIHYALGKPAVASVLVGCANEAEVKEALRYLEAPKDELEDLSVLAESPKYSMSGKCMYCNHCQPCPAGIDIAAVTKYMDLYEYTKAATVQEHYRALERHGSDCIQCGQCEPRCPFGVQVRENMMKAQEMFRD